MGPSLSFNSIILLSGASALLLGTVLLRRGRWPRRIGDTPHCPRCDYILVGMKVGRCPECGTPILRETTRFGERHRHHGIAAVGSILLLLGLLTTGTGVTGSLAGIKWYQHTPFVWVLRDLRSTDFVHNQTALVELKRRAAAGKLSAAQRDAWIDRMLADVSTLAGSMQFRDERDLLERMESRNEFTARQTSLWADQIIREARSSFHPANDAGMLLSWSRLVKLWDSDGLSPVQQRAAIQCALTEQVGPNIEPLLKSEVLEFLGRLALGGSLTPEEHERFFRNMTLLDFKVRPRVGQLDHTPYEITSTGRVPIGWRQSSEFAGAWIDDQAVQGRGGSIGSTEVGGGIFSSSLDVQRPGRHTVRIRVETTFRSNKSPPRAPPIHVETRELVGEFDVTRDLSPIKWLDEPDAVRMVEGVTAGGFELSPAGFRPLMGWIRLDRIPANVAFEAFARIDGIEYSLGTIALGRGKQRNCFVGSPKPPSGAITQFDLILRASETAAKATTDLFEIWNGELVIPNVPVTDFRRIPTDPKDKNQR